MENESANTSMPNHEPDEPFHPFADLHIILDVEGKILEYKPGYFQPNPASQMIIIGNRLQELLTGLALENFEHALQSAQPEPFEFRLSVAGQERWFRAQ